MVVKEANTAAVIQHSLQLIVFLKALDKHNNASCTPSSALNVLFINNFTFFQSLVGVCGGATRAALTQHQARRDNMADVSAKDGSQV